MSVAVSPVMAPPTSALPSRDRTQIVCPSSWDPVGMRIDNSSRAQRAETTAAPIIAGNSFGPGIPDPLPWSKAVARASVETLTGARQLPQLTRWLSPDLYEALERRIALSRRLGMPTQKAVAARVLSGRIQRASATDVEAAIVVHDGKRIRAVALRLTTFRGRWRVTALEIG